jgi:hypothetical protein
MRIVKLTERDLTRLVSKTLNEVRKIKIREQESNDDYFLLTPMGSEDDDFDEEKEEIIENFEHLLDSLSKGFRALVYDNGDKTEIDYSKRFINQAIKEIIEIVKKLDK